MKCSSYHRFFETVASSLRWAILEALQRRSMSVSEICEELNEEQSKISHNLKILHECHIVDFEKDGKRRIYSLNTETILPLIKLVHSHVAGFCGKECLKVKE